MALNALTDDEKKTPSMLPPTDSRFRPDIRKMEEGDLDLAGKEKDRLEEKQRTSRRGLEKRREEWQPRYCDLVFFVLRLHFFDFSRVTQMVSHGST